MQLQMYSDDRCTMRVTVALAISLLMPFAALAQSGEDYLIDDGSIDPDILEDIQIERHSYEDAYESIDWENTDPELAEQLLEARAARRRVELQSERWKVRDRELDVERIARRLYNPYNYELKQECKPTKVELNVFKLIGDSFRPYKYDPADSPCQYVWYRQRIDPATDKVIGSQETFSEPRPPGFEALKYEEQQKYRTEAAKLLDGSVGATSNQSSSLFSN